MPETARNICAYRGCGVPSKGRYCQSHAKVIGALFYPERGTEKRETFRAQDFIPEGPSAIPLIAICGPPGAGKTAIARELAAPGDLVLDLDEIKAALSGLPLYEADDSWVERALTERNRKLASLAVAPSEYERAWLILTAPSVFDRRLWVSRMHAQILIVDTPLSECLRRIQLDSRRREPFKHEEFARRWWTKYVSDSSETCVRTAEQARIAIRDWSQGTGNSST